MVARRLRLVRAHSPELLLLDIWMPVMNGLEVLENLRGNTQAVGVKVVVLSQQDDADTHLEGYALGIEDYWTKDLSLDELCRPSRVTDASGRGSALAIRVAGAMPDRATMPQEYQERVNYLYSRLNYEKVGMPKVPAELRLGRMRRLLRQLGDPHIDLPIVHIAGTKGKGSTAAMIASALARRASRTGLYCSPHLHRLEERFTVNGVPASPAEVVALVDEVRESVEPARGRRSSTWHSGPDFLRDHHRDGPPLLCAARSVRSFSKSALADASTRPTRSIRRYRSSQASHSITPGNWAIRSVPSREKAGILKRDRPAICGVIGHEARDAIRATARERRCRLYELGADFWYDNLPPVQPLSCPTKGRVAVRSWRRDWGTLSLPLLGSHQAHNAAVALAGLDLLAEVNPRLAVSRSDVVGGFASLRWPARVEVVSERPWLVIDGAHNSASAAALAETLQSCFPPTRRTLVFGTTRDKDIEAQLRALLPLFDIVIATRYIENPRSVPPDQISALVSKSSAATLWTAAEPGDALAIAREATSPAGLICVTGSLFLAAEARAIVMPELRSPAIPGIAR